MKRLTLFVLLLALAMPRAAKGFAFQDSAVKAICVANWDTDGDGELSFAEAAAVTSLGTAFRGHAEITSFLELQYFTSLTSLTCDDGYGTFQACYNLDLVYLPDALTTIGKYAFYDCRALRRIEIPSAVTLIDESAFESCWSLYTVDYRGGCDYSSLNTINEGAFSRCDVLTSFSIPYGVTEISANTFSYSGLRQIEIPSQVTSIGNSAFYHCVFLRTLTLCNNLTSIGESAFEDCSTLTTLAIPNSVTSIGASAFLNCTGLTTVNLGSSLHSIEESTFQNCSALTTLNLGSYLQIIGESAFKNCSGLIVVTIPNNVTTIERYAFENCSSLTSLDLGSHLTSIKEYAFEGCIGLSSLTIPSSVTTIKKNAFNNCTNLTSVTINSNALASATYSISEDLSGIHYDNFRSRFGNQVTSYTFGSNVTAIGDYACYNCTGMTSVNLGYVDTIGNYAFRGCSGLTSLTIPNYVTSIGEYAFYNCSGMTSVIIGNSLTSISNSTFGHCSGMTTVTIPSSVTSIDGYAFSECSGLTRVNYTGTLGGWCNISFSTQSSNPLLYAHNLYINDELVTTANWSISGSVTIIKPYAFYGCTGLNSVTIPLSVTSIGNSAFGGCTALTSVTLRSNAVVSATYTSSNNFSTIFGNQVESYTLSGLPSYPIQAIGNYAFYGCSGMTSLDIPNSLTSIGESAFRNCSGLTYFTFPSSVTSIGQYAFRGCSGLNSITIPNSVTSINSYTFYGCSGLTSVTIGNSVTSIGQYAFSGCSGLNSITIPNSVTSIGNYAFSDCTGLTEMTVERTTPPNAAANTFSNVPNTIPIYVPCGTKEAYQATNWNYFTNIVDPCGIITFADANVKSLCVQYWDSNQDGELSYDEAAAVTTLKPQGVTNSVFYNKPNITSFNELQYFTGLTSLAPNAFNYCSSLASVTLPNSVTTIGQYAFNRCTSLVSVSLGNSVVTIDNNAFSYCSQLASVTLPNTVTTIGNFAFENCTSLTAIELPNSLTSIGNRAFNNTSLTSIVIPASVTSLVDNPFRFPSQATITVDENNPVYSSPNNCNAIIKTGTNELVVGCKNSVIPSTVTSIAAYAFYGCNGLTSITIPDAVVSIGDYSFRECTGLTSITFSNTLSSIGTCAFWNCSGLSSITLPSTLASIGSSAFYNCTGLTSITVEASAPPTLDGTTVFNHVNTGIPVIVPCESLETYQTYNNGQPWGGFSNIQCDDCTVELPLSENFDSYQGVTSGSVNVLPDCWSRINTTTVSSQQGYPTITEYNYAQSAPNFLYFMSSYVVGSYEDPQDQYAILPSVDNVSDLVLSLSARIPAGGRNGTFMVGVMTDPTDASTFTSLATFAPTTTTYQQYTLAFNSYSGEGHYIAIKMPAASSDVYYRGLCIDDVTLDIVSSPNIVFADATVKALCVANWDTNGDNELSYAEAAAVTSLGEVFQDAFQVQGTSVTFNELQYFTGLTSIGENAFSGCWRLSSITLPSTVTSIESSAFAMCSSLTSINIPNSVTTIGSWAFMYCGLTAVELPNSMTTLGIRVFNNCSSLTSIEIPANVTSIGLNPFSGCNNLTSITVAGGNTHYSSPNNNCIVETASHTLISGLSNTVIPDDIQNIGNFAFSSQTGLTSIMIPALVTHIGTEAFASCANLAEITLLAETPPTVGSNAFYNVPTTIPVNVPCGTQAAYQAAAGWNAFPNIMDPCGNIVFADENVKDICVANWDTNDDGELSYPEAASVTDLGGVFSDNEVITSFNELQYFTGLTAIEYEAFYYCTNLTSVIIPSGVTTIVSEAFYECTNLHSVTIPSGVTEIGYNAFYACTSLVSISLPNTLTFIDEFAFEDCTSLTSITIPSSVNYIEGNPFKGCLALASIIVEADNTVYDSRNDCNAIIETASNTLQAGCKNTVIPSTVTSIGYTAFEECISLASITIPSSVTSIGQYAFYGCTSLASISLSNGLTTIYSSAFYGCSSLTSITIPSSVTSIGNYAFKNCTGLTSITVEATTPPTLGTNAFQIVPAGIPVYVPCGELSAYQNDPGWSHLNGQSGWFENFVEHCTLTVNDGTVDNTYVPVYGYWCDQYSKSQFIIPASDLQTLQQNVITKLTFYSQQSNVSWGDALFDVYLAEVEETEFEDATLDWTGMAKVLENASLSIADNKMEVVLSQPYLYQGGNLKVGVKQVVSGSYVNCTWYGVSKDSNVAIGGYETTRALSLYPFLPKTTFDYIISTVQSNIEFADLAVKALCVANWDTNNDGELSYLEAAAVTDLGNVFQEEPITTFNELQYFTGLIEIEDEAFMGCTQLTSIIIPSSVTTIDSYVFDCCYHLTSITIPSSVTTIIGNPFTNCLALASITVEAGNTVYDSRNGCNAIIHTQTNTLITGCKNTVIPSGIVSIGNSAFYGCKNLTSITFPVSLTSIGKYAFDYCNHLTSVTLPNGVTSIGKYAFEFCTALTSVTLPNGISTLSEGVFNRCSSLASITIPSGVTSIGNYAFAFSGLTSITIPSGVTEIGDYAFRNCTGLTSITVEAADPPTLGNYAFQNVPTSIPVNVPCGTKAAYQNASGWSVFTNFVDPCEAIVFADDNVKALCVQNWDTNGDGELSYPEAAEVTSLNEVFNGNEEITSFNELQYFTGLTSIGEDFYNCNSLESITLPNTITSISGYAFQECASLTSITIPSGVAEIGYNPFANCPALASIIVEAGNTVYDSRDNCNAIIETASDMLITGCKNTVIPSTVTIIGLSAFQGCSDLTSFTIPNGVTTIGQYAFQSCNALASISLPSTLTSIGNYAFNYCSSLTSVTIPSGVTYIGSNAFQYCTALASISIPSTVTSIGNYAFNGCTGLTSITLEAETPPSVSNTAFNNVLNTIPVYVPCGSVGAYQAHNGWQYFNNFIGEGCSQENTLVDGWNWWAPTVAMSLTELETALNGNAILINSQDGGFLRYENGSWSGTLPAIEVGKMYKIMTSAVCTLSVQGNRPAVVTVTLEPGYTWFGYTKGTQAADIATALGYFVPATGDMIIGENGTATYTGGTWTGNLTELVPGHGYVYFSTYNNTRTLILR